ncbi:MAG: hypothetical protein WBD34_19120 [Burkholderiaceae bacterium]
MTCNWNAHELASNWDGAKGHPAVVSGRWSSICTVMRASRGIPKDALEKLGGAFAKMNEGKTLMKTLS